MPQIPAPLPLNSLLRAGGLSVSGSAPGPAQSAIAQPTPSTPQDRLQTTAAGSASASLHLGQPPLIGPGTRVLHIGDSHTVGIYGREMDKMLRATGAQVASYGSAGSSPRWWLDGTTTRSGYFGSGEDGKIDAPADWRTPRQTPKLPDLLKKHQPSVVMISLGANLLGADGATIEKQVKQLAEVARTSGAKIVWVGPPDGRESNKPTSKQAALYKHLQQAASQYGTFIDSRPLTEYPATGGDGVHYWGKEGTKIARNWAQEVFEQVQASAP
jgi:hypothetical protein